MEEDIPYLLIGTVGWEHTEWSDGYYSEEEPEEWRFLTYSGHFRSVLLPATVWQQQANPAQWAEEADDQFRFVLELPEGLAQPGRSGEEIAQAAEDFFQQVAPIRQQTVGLYLQLVPQAVDLVWLRELLSVITGYAPLNIALPREWQSEAVMLLLQEFDTGQCWFPDESDSMPEQHGQWMMAITATEDQKRIRHIIEQLAPVLEQGTEAGLFFRGHDAANTAWQARIIADLLVV